MGYSTFREEIRSQTGRLSAHKLGDSPLTNWATLRSQTGRFFLPFFSRYLLHLRPMNVCISDRGGERETFMEVFYAIFRQRTNKSAHASSLIEGRQQADYRQTDQPPSRLIGLVILTLIGIWFLAALPEHSMSRQAHAIVGQTVPIRPSLPALDGPQGTQAGGGEIPRQNRTAHAPPVPAFCL